MNKKILLTGLVLIIIAGQITFGQTKIYTGSFNSNNFQGTSKYNYIEQPENRIFDGEFTFKSSRNAVSIVGNYKNNLKDGVWNINLNNVANTDVLMKYLITANVKGSYNDGELQGSWSLNRTKVISFSNSGISDYYKFSINALSYLFDGETVDFNKSMTVIEKSTTSFIDNHFSGDFIYEINNGKSVVKGQFNKDGYLNGLWIVNYYQNGILHNQIRTYDNGVLLTIKNKNNSTGDISTIYDETIEVQEFFQNYNSVENSSKIGTKYYKLKENKTTESDISFLEDAIAIWYNSNSIAKSAYIFEIERGVFAMTVYPKREIIFDSEMTKKHKNEQAQVLEEKRKYEEVKKEKERELEYEKQKLIREFKYSDYGKLQESIKDEFNKWLIKTDFEASLDYDNRIKNQSKQKFENIILEKIHSSKNRHSSLSASLYDYDSERQSFNIVANKDTFAVKISSSIAPKVSSYIKNKQKNDRRNSIKIIPEKMTMYKNKWMVTEALIIFNIGGRDASCVQNRSGLKLLISEKGNKLYGKCDAAGFNQFEIKNINTFTSNLPYGVYYTNWNRTNQSNFDISKVQSLNFTFDNLGIVLPFE